MNYKITWDDEKNNFIKKLLRSSGDRALLS